MIAWLLQYKKLILITVLALTATIYFSSMQENQIEVSEIEDTLAVEQAQQAENVNETVPAIQTIMVDVKGEVGKPGVYTAEPGDRVKDIIEKAGGFTEKADQKQINLSEHLQDEMVIYIPFAGENASNAYHGPSSQEKKEGKVNLNTADENALQTLPGIGPSKSAAIIEYRNTNGAFQKIEDLKNITGIGEKTFEKLKELISIQ